jgi:hypothetical protein
MTAEGRAVQVCGDPLSQILRCSIRFAQDKAQDGTPGDAASVTIEGTPLAFNVYLNALDNASLR